MSTDLFQAPDYFHLDELLNDEHKLVREAARDWVKREVSPIIEDSCQKAEFPKHLISGLADIGAFGPYIPEAHVRLVPLVEFIPMFNRALARPRSATRETYIVLMVGVPLANLGQAQVIR